MVRWSDLTKEEQENFGNGCGGLTKFFKVPDFIFEASCRQHDFYYHRGGWFFAKIKADWEFYRAMLRDCKRYEGKERLIYTILASGYFCMVLCVGWPFFEYGTSKTKEYILAMDSLTKAYARD